MNYLPYVGYWFYGATSAAERASFYSSWGLLEVGGVPPAWTPRRRVGLLMGVMP